MLLTAGLGTRLRPITEKYAKPAVPFLNVPLMYYPIPLLESLGATSLVLNTHHKPEQIEALAAHIPGSKMPVAFSPEIETPLGSGGGIWQARKHLEGGGSFLVANGDEVILPKNSEDLMKFTKAHDESGALATISVMRHPLVGTQFGGVWADNSGRVLGFGKNRADFPQATQGLHYIGLLLLRDEVFRYLPQGESNIFYDVLKTAIAQGEKVQCAIGDFTWYESGNPRDFLISSGEALALLQSNGKRSDRDFLQMTCQRFWPAGSQLNGQTLFGPGARVEDGSHTAGFLVLGKNSVIKRGATARNAILLDGASVETGKSCIGEISF